MADREATPMDQAVFDATLEAELGKGTDRRVAEGRAKSAAVRAYRKAHPEVEAEHAARLVPPQQRQPATARLPHPLRPRPPLPPAAAAAVGAPLAYAAPPRRRSGPPPRPRAGSRAEARRSRQAPAPALVPPRGCSASSASRATG
jgi:hypothetical protein